MARFWKEPYNPAAHYNRMYEIPVFKSPDLKLIPQFVYFVSVCSFTFEFHSLEQIEICLEYYSEKIHPSSRLPVYTQNLGGDHWGTLRWFERVPMYLLEEPKRQRVVKALTRALEKFGEKNENSSKRNEQF